MACISVGINECKNVYFFILHKYIIYKIRTISLNSRPVVSAYTFLPYS